MVDVCLNLSAVRNTVAPESAKCTSYASLAHRHKKSSDVFYHEFKHELGNIATNREEKKEVEREDTA